MAKLLGYSLSNRSFCAIAKVRAFQTGWQGDWNSHLKTVCHVRSTIETQPSRMKKTSGLRGIAERLKRLTGKLGEKMAPEEGLEPSTPRLTAACSTIELLWNAKDEKSNGGCAGRQFQSVTFFGVQSPKSKVQSPKSKVQSPKSKVQSRGTRDGVGPEGAEVGNLVLSFEFFLGAMVCKRRVLLIRRRVWLAKAPSSLRFAGAVQDAVGSAMAMGKGREWSGGRGSAVCDRRYRGSRCDCEWRCERRLG